MEMPYLLIIGQVCLVVAGYWLAPVTGSLGGI